MIKGAYPIHEETTLHVRLLQSGHDIRGIQCAEDYSGPYPLSEPETQHIVNYFRQNAPIIGVIDWHSYGELILRPWGKSSNNQMQVSQVRLFPVRV